MAELEKVRIRHPRIDDGQRVIEVRVSALSHYQRSGWEQVTEGADEPPVKDAAPADPPPDGGPTTEQDTEAPAEPGASSSEGTEQPPRRRRAPRGDE
ncbi:hypothetical protein ACFQ08_14505 [Streptosporangium algeriense]|uniref:Uncharacterized protein n=1 Tax=Streptosporangium algeriense TaxID=1682748 RepID=A0ABW3DRZ9_9ACTN